MNEELKIVIKATVDEALKKIKQVKDEVGDVGEESKKASKTMSDSFKSAARTAQLQVEAIKQVISGIVNLGKSSIEAQKEIGRLNAAFLSSGSTAKQAGETYKKIFGFLGDSGAAVEAAQQLANITPDAAKLEEYGKILQGVYATFGTSIETGGLAEGINHTIQLGSVQGTLADSFEFSGIAVEAVNEKLATLNSEAEREAFLRSTLNNMYGQSAALYEQNNASLIAHNQSQASLNVALAEAGKVVVPLITAFNNLAGILLTVLKPALEVIVAVLVVVIQAISSAVKWLGSFFGAFKGGESSANTIADGVTSAAQGAKAATGGVGGLNKALGSAAKAAKELKKQTMGFDELNIVSSGAEATAGAGAGASVPSGGGFEMPEIPSFEGIELPNLDTFNATLEEVKAKLEPILVLVGLVAAGFLAWKIASFLQDAEKLALLLETLPGKIQSFGGILMIIAGAVLLVQGYCDAWVNGIDWANFAAMIGGVALVVGGLALAVSPLAAGIAAIAGGIALIIIGIKDFVENGYSMEAVLTILAGVIAVVVGVCLAFNAALLANPITWIVVGIAALVAAFVILWNECEGFRNFWIGLWEGIKTLFGAFVDWIAPKVEAVAQFFVTLWEGIKTSLTPLVEAIQNAFTQAWELILVVWDLVKPYFEAIWDAIKTAFSVVAEILGGFFSAAWEAIKLVWDVVKDYFQLCWDNIKEVFSVVKTYFEGMFKTAWEAIKFVWDTVVGYFKAIWDTIAGIFSVVKNVLTGNWKEAWEGIKGIVNTWKEYFSGVWDGIKRVFSSVKTWFSDTFSAAWEAVKNIFSNWGSFFKELWNKVTETFTNIGEKIGSAVSGAITTAVNWVLEKAVGIINGFIGAINLAIGVINAIPGVEISKLKKLEVPKLAQGGIVDSATLAIVGERGKEAIMPLENNTGWIDTLAEMLNSKMGGSINQPIILQVDGKTFAQISVDSINQLTKQTGNLPLVIA